MVRAMVNFRDQIVRFLDSSGMTPTALGQEALGDGAFVTDVLQHGRSPRLDTVERLTRYMQRQELEPKPIDPPSRSASLHESATGRVLEFKLDQPFPLLNVTLRQHYHKRHRTAQSMAWEIKVATHGHLPQKPFARAKVQIVRRSTGRPDKDGLYGGAKGLIDCLLPNTDKRGHGLGIIADDNPDVIDLNVQSERVLSREGKGTFVTITEILPAA